MRQDGLVLLIMVDDEKPKVEQPGGRLHPIRLARCKFQSPRDGGGQNRGGGTCAQLLAENRARRAWWPG
jgi:hypothetical protein